MQANRKSNVRPTPEPDQGTLYSTSSSATGVGAILTITPVTKPPAELRRHDQWVSWNYECDEAKPAEPRKPPVAVTEDGRLRRISATDPDSHLSWQAAREQTDRYMLAGVGFVFTADDPYFGFDLDGCRDPDSGRVEAWAVQILKAFRGCCYVEVSPSGTGLKGWGKGKKPPGAPNKWHPVPGDADRAIEVYDCNRYFTVTGQVLKGYTTIRSAQDALDRLCLSAPASAHRFSDRSASAPRNTDLSNEEILLRVKRAHPNRYEKLFEAGATEDDDKSKLDFELACQLAEQLGNDPERIEDLMYQSALERDKWDREDYLPRTIARAIEETPPPIGMILPEDPETEDDEEEKVTLNFRTAAAIEPLPVEWLWRPYVVRGALNLCDGDPGVGKSSLSLSIVATALSGRLPNGCGDLPETVSLPAKLGEDATVLVASAEDEPSRTLRPKLDVLGLTHAALARVHILDDFTTEEGRKEPLNLGYTSHVLELTRHVRTHRAGILIIDPIMAFAGDTDTNRDADVRQMLHPLATLAAETGCTIIAVRHLAKQAKDRAIYRGGGSIAFAGAARSVLLVGCNPDDPAEKVVVHIKANYSEPGPALRYRMTPREHPTLGGEIGTVEWLGIADNLTAAQVLAPDRPQKRGKLGRAAVWLQEILAKGPMDASAIEAAADEEGISKQTLRRATEEVRVHKTKKRSPSGKLEKWQWELAEGHGGLYQDERQA